MSRTFYCNVNDTPITLKARLYNPNGSKAFLDGATLSVVVENTQGQVVYTGAAASEPDSIAAAVLPNGILTPTRSQYAYFVVERPGQRISYPNRNPLIEIVSRG
jgi:hypothetical protein